MAALIIFMGPTGAGKSVQAERLSRELGCIHLSSGDLLRRDPVESRVLASGELVPSGEVERIVGEAIREVDPEEVIILDGFPRTLDETLWLVNRLPSWDRTISHVIFFDVEQKISSERLNQRQRSDDSPEAQAVKWNEYTTETKPVIELFRKQGLLTTVDGNASIDALNLILKDLLA